LAGGDFETASSWSLAGGSNHATLARTGPNELDAATGQHYLRLAIDGSGTYAACSPPFTAAASRIVVSAYVRTNLPTFDVEFRPQSGAPATKTLASTGDWKFHNIQSLAVAQTGDGFHLSVPGQNNLGSICFTAIAPSNASSTTPYYVDIDALSANGY
jgi:hypothetical protein